MVVNSHLKTPIPGNLTPASDLCGTNQVKVRRHTYRQNTHKLLNFKNLKIIFFLKKKKKALQSFLKAANCVVAESSRPVLAFSKMARRSKHRKALSHTQEDTLRTPSLWFTVSTHWWKSDANWSLGADSLITAVAPTVLGNPFHTIYKSDGIMRILYHPELPWKLHSGWQKNIL